MEYEATLWAFTHFFFSDKANAAMHCAPVKFSPITFRLADELKRGDIVTPELQEVWEHVGLYELDSGR